MKANNCFLKVERRDFWNQVWETFSRKPRGNLFASLETRWREPHRRHHDGRHLAECLDLLIHWIELAQFPNEVAIAIWFHDAIYDPKSTQNERDSANWAVRELTVARVNGDSIDRIEELILSTDHGSRFQHHEQPDMQLLHDIDMAVLGSQPERYRRYQAGVASEYSFAGDAYASGRGRFLQSLLDSEWIYKTPAGRSTFEEQARANIQQELTDLQTK